MHDGGIKLGLARNQTVSGKREFPILLWSVFFKWGHNLIFSPVEMDFTDNIPDDTSVIHNTLRGNINSFEILMDRYQDYVARIVRNHVPRDEAPEVAHDTFVQAYQSLGGFQGTGPFKHWLAKIAIRCCHDFWRGYYKKPENLVGPLPDACRNWVDHLLTDQSPERDAERVEARDLLAVGLGAIVGGGQDSVDPDPPERIFGGRGGSTSGLERHEGKGPISPGPEEAPEDSGENSSPRNGMKSSKEQIDKIETTLIAAHRRPEDLQIPSGLAATGDAGYTGAGWGHCVST